MNVAKIPMLILTKLKSLERIKPVQIVKMILKTRVAVLRMKVRMKARRTMAKGIPVIQRITRIA